MNKRIVMHSLLFAFLVLLGGDIVAYHSESDCKQIECTLIPLARSIHKERRDVDSDTVEGECRSHPHIPAPHSSQTRLPDYSAFSTNWSGYVAADNLNNPTLNSVSAVQGSWVVPAIVPSCNDTYSAFWIGIDGYTSPTVEQIGTAHDFIGGVEDYFAWFEMYPNPAFLINNFPVNPGDVISASVVYAGSNVFTLSITNNTQGVSFTVPSSFTTVSGTLRNCAEWIMEAPFLNGILPLTDFVTGYMRGCTATINGISAPINAASRQNVDIIMVTNASVPKAIPTALLQDNASFFIVWKHQ